MVGIEKSVICPAGVICPILSPAFAVNQRLPSGPAAIPEGKPSAGGIENSVICPVGVIRPILFAVCSVNHRLPSPPAAIAKG